MTDAIGRPILSGDYVLFPNSGDYYIARVVGPGRNRRVSLEYPSQHYRDGPVLQKTTKWPDALVKVELDQIETTSMLANSKNAYLIGLTLMEL